MDFLLVVPCLNESERLPSFLPGLLEALTNQPYRCAVLVVDDGSTEEEKLFLENYLTGLRETHGDLLCEPMMLKSNLGKGGAIRSGWRKGDHTAGWLAFVDADGAVPPHEVAGGFARAFADKERRTCYFASRMGGNGKKVERDALRKLAGWVFARLAGFMMKTDLKDTQCGFKVIPGELFTKADPLFQENGYCFDLEILSAAKHFGFKVVEFAIDWKEIAGGKIKAGDVFKMIRQIAQLKKRVRSWE